MGLLGDFFSPLTSLLGPANPAIRAVDAEKTQVTVASVNYMATGGTGSSGSNIDANGKVLPLVVMSSKVIEDSVPPKETTKSPSNDNSNSKNTPFQLTLRQNNDGVTLRQATGLAIEGYKGKDKEIWTRTEPALLFPSNLTTTALKFPFIGFWARKGANGERSIFLPIPPGISFSDQMQYSAIDLGIMGSIVAKATTAAVNEGNVFSAAGGALGAGAGAIVNKIKSTNAAAIASLAAKMVGSDNLSNAIDFGARQVIAPNTNTAFQNSTVRQFQFSFKMMPKDQKEAITITEIIKRFRQNMYPMGNDLILTYPPIWNIKFYDGAKTEENTKLPGIYDCYLIGMSAVYNSSGNMFHADGHPVETDVQLTFEETRALTLADIVDLSEGRTA